MLGKLNAAIFLSPLPSPEKQTYVVRPGDVITRVAVKYKTTPELLMRSNNLSGSMLRIGQRLLIAPERFLRAHQPPPATGDAAQRGQIL